MLISPCRIRTIVLLAALIAALPVGAQPYPSRPIKLISGYGPGGNNDTSARLFARELETRIGQPVIVENRPGGGGTIGTRYVAKAEPDGYTLLYSDVSSMTSILSLNGLDDVFKQLEPVSLMSISPWVLYITTKHPVKTFGELISYARAHPQAKLNLGATNIFSTLSMGVLNQRTGVDLFFNVPYKGQSEVSLAMAKGEVDLAFDSILLYKPLIESGKIRPLFVTRASSLLPGVPTAAQAGVPDFKPGILGGIWTPAGTPKAIVAKLTAEFSSVIASAQVRDLIRTRLGADPSDGSAQALRSEAEAGITFQAEAARLANFKPQ